MAGVSYPVRIPRPIPPGARKVLRLAVAILAVEVVVVGVALGAWLPLSEALAAVLIVELAFVAVWGLALRRITKARFGVALPRLERE